MCTRALFADYGCSWVRCSTDTKTNLSNINRIPVYDFDMYFSFLIVMIPLELSNIINKLNKFARAKRSCYCGVSSIERDEWSDRWCWMMCSLAANVYSLIISAVIHSHTSHGCAKYCSGTASRCHLVNKNNNNNTRNINKKCPRRLPHQQKGDTHVAKNIHT